MEGFTTWFAEKLRVSRYPVPGEIRKLPAGSFVINVSDEWIPSCQTAAMEAAVCYHWLPLNECVGDLGINSIFGALQVLHYAEQRNAAVLLHCHAGICRSRLVADAYYFMRTGQHVIRQRQANSEVDQWLGITAADLGEYNKTNALLDAVGQGLLPRREQLEQFLTRYGQELERLDVTYRGGLLTQLKMETQFI